MSDQMNKDVLIGIIALMGVALIAIGAFLGESIMLPPILSGIAFLANAILLQQMRKSKGSHSRR